MNAHSPEAPLAKQALRRVGASLRGRYRIERLIGVGGMAAVYAGVHRNGHAVAIKILHQRLSADPEIERLFRREALLANKVNHPGLVPVIDDDIAEDGCTFLVMPLLVGETLRARASRMGNRLPVAEVVVVAHAVLGALKAAHDSKIIHRDIKPENVFLTAAGETRILDFGIGRLLEATDVSATHSGRAIGTPAFMPPEQALGHHRSLDERTDLWSVGATMFALLSGRLVHEGTTPGETVVFAATRHPAPLREVAPDVPSALADVVDRALRFERGDRWPDAGTMARALEEACASSLGREISTLPRPAGPKPEARKEVRDEPAGTPRPTPSLVQRGLTEAESPSSNVRVAHSTAPSSWPRRAPLSTGRVPSVDEVNLRGTAVAPLRSFVLKHFGERAWANFVADFDPVRRELLEQPIIATNWYPYTYCCAYIDQLVVLAEGRPSVLRDFAIHTLDYATTMVFRAIFKLGTPEFMVARSDQVWKKLYSHGYMVCDVTAGHGRIELHDFPMLNGRYEEVVKYSIEAVLLKAGASVSRAETTKSTLSGDPFSEFTYDWT